MISVILYNSRTRKCFAFFHNCMWESWYSGINFVYLFSIHRKITHARNTSEPKRLNALWIHVHQRLSPFLIICSLFLVELVGSLCCFLRLLNPNSFIQLSLKEIVGDCRGDKYAFSYIISPVSITTFFRDTISCACIVKSDCITFCLIELQSFSLSKLYIDPTHRILVPFPLLLARCKTWFGQIKLLRSLLSLFMGFTAVKNTVFLSLHKICPPAINPEFVMECKLTAHPKCYMYLNIYIYIYIYIYIGINIVS